jgi:serine/threonine protein kinase
MEYCRNGNLREFLRNNRSWYNAEEESFDRDISQVFGPKNLIYFAWQITKGMTFLISRKVIKFPYHSLSQYKTNQILYTNYMYRFSPMSLPQA